MYVVNKKLDELTGKHISDYSISAKNSEKSLQFNANVWNPDYFVRVRMSFTFHHLHNLHFPDLSIRLSY